MRTGTARKRTAAAAAGVLSLSLALFDPKVVFRSAHRVFSPTARASKSRVLADARREKSSIAEAIER